MRYPLNSVSVNPGGGFRVVAVPGTGLRDSNGVSRHIGVDLFALVGTEIYAPGLGVITESYVGGSGLQVLAMRIGNYDHRFLHVSQRLVPVGATVREGQLIAKSGNSGKVKAHLHWDVRKAGTPWNQSLNNYVDPMSIINQGGAAMFNEGDRVNINNYLYGEDRGQHREWIGRDWKSAMYGIFESPYFGFESRVNDGDVANMSGAKPASGQKNKVWKKAAYDFLIPNQSPNQYEPINEQLFRQKK